MEERSFTWDESWVVRGLVSAWCCDSRKGKTRLRECGVTPSLRDGSMHLQPPNSLCSKHFLSWESVCERVCIWYFLTGVCDRKPGSTPSQCNQQVCPPWQVCRVETASVYSLCLSFCFFCLSVSLSMSARGADLEKQYMKAICLEGLMSCAQYISPLH